jgi:hypothetical protein
MKTSLSARLNITTWIAAGLILVIIFFQGKPLEQFTAHVIATLYWMGAYYLFFLYMAPAFLIQGKFKAFFGISLLILLGLPFFGYSLLLLSRALFAGDFSDFYRLYTFDVHMSGFKAMVMAGVFGSFFRLIAEHFRK